MLDNFGNVCYGCIYKITNLINRKCYIGQTTREYSMYIQKHFKNALNGHSKSKHFYNAIHKYGKKNFKWKILGFCYSLEELDLAEIESIWLFRSYGSDGENYDIIYGYNHTIGGRGLIDLIHSEEWKTNHSNMMVGENNPMFGTNGFYGKWVEEYGLEIADEMQKELYEKRDEKIRNRSEEEKNITKLKQKETWKNKTKEEKQKTFNKRSKSSSGKNNPRAKKYILINPEGEEIFLHGEFYKFCEIHNLSRHCLKRVAKGELTNWKGWKCINVTNK